MVITSIVFCSNDCDSYLCLKTASHDCIIISLYVGDMIITIYDVDNIIK